MIEHDPSKAAKIRGAAFMIFATGVMLGLAPSHVGAERLLSKAAEVIPSFAATPSDQPPLSLGLSTGNLLYVSRRLNDRHLEILPAKEGALVTAILDSDPRTWSDSKVAKAVLRLLETRPARVLLSSAPAANPARIAVPETSSTTVFLTCLSLDRPASGPLTRKEAIELLNKDISTGAFDILGPLSINLASKVVASPSLASSH